MKMPLINLCDKILTYFPLYTFLIHCEISKVSLYYLMG